MFSAAPIRKQSANYINTPGWNMRLTLVGRIDILRAMGGKRLILAALALCWGSSCVLSAKATPCTGDACIEEGDEIECDIPNELPEGLLATCFAEIEDGRLAPNLRPFEPRFGMFTGEGAKKRWIYIPPGETIDATDADEWRYPTGTIIWQEISDVDRIETQVLEKNGEGVGRSAWRASAYLWTEDQTDAHRERQSERRYAIDSATDWSEPDESTCMVCHQGPEDVVLGFTALQLSDPDLAGSFEEWSDYLSSTSSTTGTPEPASIVGSETDQRMLGYLHTNCGGCHSARGSVAGLGLELDYSIATADLESSNAFATALYKDLQIVPGNPAGSSVYSLFASGEMPPARRTTAIDLSTRADLSAWIVGLEWPTRIMTDAPAIIDADSADGRALLGYDTTIDDELQGTAFSRSDRYDVRSRAVIPIDPSLTYRVSGRFRSNGATLSRFYYGLAPYDAAGQFISAYRANRRGALTTVDLAATTAGSIVTTAPVDDWNLPTTFGFQRAVGIYYDGDPSHLPDYVHTKPDNQSEIGPQAGAFSSAVGNTITLNVDLPAEVLAQISAETIIANHHSGSTYLYSAAASLFAGSDWTDFSGDLTGTAFTASALQFRPETAYVKLIILANYQQEGQATELLWDELRLEVVATP